MLDWLRQAMGPTRAYEQLTMAGALAALLVLWIAVGPHLPHRAMLLGVGLVGSALIVVIAWQVVHVLVARAGDSQRLKVIRQNLDPDAFIPAFARAEEAAQRAAAFTIVAWPLVFLLAALAGLAGALLITYDAFAGAAGLASWPVEPPAAHATAQPSLDIAPNDW